MIRDFEEMKLARVIDACRGIDGRVKMQKIVYLLTAMGYDLPFDDFVIRQQGPFSRAVACSADILTGAGVIKEDRSGIGSDQYGEPIYQYHYQVREGMVPIVRKYFEVQTPPTKPPIDELAKELNEKNRKVLEVAATRIYLEREDKLDGEELEKELDRLKGHLRGSFQDADKLLKDLRDRSLL